MHVDDWAILGGFTLVHQFCRIGAHCFTGMGSAIGKDVPYVMVTGNPAAAKSINTEGLKRRGYTKEEIAAINKVFKLVYRHDLTVDEAVKELTRGRTSRESTMIDSLTASTAVLCAKCRAYTPRAIGISLLLVVVINPYTSSR